MARIESLEEKEAHRTRLHDPVEATFHVFLVDGQTVLQIDTYGSNSRKLTGQMSQSIQFGNEGIAALRAVLATLK